MVEHNLEVLQLVLLATVVQELSFYVMLLQLKKLREEMKFIKMVNIGYINLHHQEFLTQPHLMLLKQQAEQ